MSKKQRIANDEAIARERAHQWICTYDAAQARDLTRSQFRYRAKKLGVRYRMGPRVWDGYEWSKESLEKLMPV